MALDKSTIFWDITRCRPSKVNRRFGGTHRLHLQGRISRARNQRESRWQAELSFKLVPCSASSSTLKMETICSSETSVDFRRTTPRYIPEDSTLHNHLCENFKSYMALDKLRSPREWPTHVIEWKGGSCPTFCF
jgi:hypothetical protein